MDFCGAEEERAERGGFLQKRYNISLRLRSNKHVHQTWLWPPPLIFLRNGAFFLDHEFYSFISKKQKKNKKKAKELVDV